VRYYRLATAQAGALHSEELARVTAALNGLAGSREVAAMCCLGCGVRRKLKTCAQCQVARFCGTECVSRAWPAHKPNCKLWRDMRSTGCVTTDAAGGEVTTQNEL
jgi:hypothetical protein